MLYIREQKPSLNKKGSICALVIKFVYKLLIFNTMGPENALFSREMRRSQPLLLKTLEPKSVLNKSLKTFSNIIT